MDPTSETDGVIPTQGAQSATMDPMALVKAGLSYGRKQAGLPEQFYGGTPSFADGGVVPDPSGQSAMPDPQKAMSYISGDGAIAADIVDALENDADPDGTMDPSERTMAVFGKAGTPDGASGLLAHYRTRYNGYSGAARAALSQGDLAGAAHYATQAFASVPTGHSTRFAPADGGLSMSTSKHGAGVSASDPAYSQGGTVDASNPDSMAENESTDGSVDEDPSYAAGGVVTLDHDTPDDDTRYNTLPESRNIEDRRNQFNEGTVFKKRHDGKFDLDGEDYADRHAPSGQASFGETGVIRKERAFDEGGLVDDAPVPDESGSYGAPPPTVLQAQQLDALLSAGFDKTLEQALGVEDVGSNPGDVTGGAPAEEGGFWGLGNRARKATKNMFTGEQPAPAGTPGEAPGAPARPPTMEDQANKRLYGAIGSAWEGIKSGANKAATALGSAGVVRDYPGKPDTEAAPEPAGVIPSEPQAPVTAPVTPQPAGANDYDEYAQSGENLGKAPPVKEKAAPKAAPAKSGNSYTDAAAADPEMQKYNKYLRVANQMFPWMSQGREREAYIARRMHDEESQTGREKVATIGAESRGNVATIGAESRGKIASDRNEVGKWKNEQNNMTRSRIEAAKLAQSAIDKTHAREVAVMRTRMNASPDYIESDEFKKSVTALAQASKQDPNAVFDGFLHDLKLPEAGQRAPAPAGQPTQHAPGTTRTDRNTGRQQVLQSDGKTWRDVAGK